jgi:hypothetical protein
MGVADRTREVGMALAMVVFSVFGKWTPVFSAVRLWRNGAD